MRPVRSLAIYIVIIFLGGSLLTPGLYRLTQWAAGHFSSLEYLAEKPLYRFLNRSVLALALVGLWPFLRNIGANSWQAVGVVKPAGQWRHLAGGFALGFGSLAVVALLAIAMDGRRWELHFSGAALFARLCKAGLSAVTVAMLEELLFRGALFGALRKSFHWVTALIVSSFLYALVHFFQKTPSPPVITWTSGFELLARMLAGFADVETFLPGFFSLAVSGIILALAYQRTGTLYFSIGLHAGWVFWLKSYGFFTSSQSGAGIWFWGTAKLIDGWLALIVLTLVFIFLWHWQKQTTQPSYVS